MKVKAIICDLDGTVALFHKKGHRGPYDASLCEQDEVNFPVLEVIKKFQDSHCILFTSGRETCYDVQTVCWLKNACGLEPKDYFLFMRATGDKRKDCVVKEEIYRNLIEPNFEVTFCLDDRNQVVEFWRSIGLTCFQVAEGNF